MTAPEIPPLSLTSASIRATQSSTTLALFGSEVSTSGRVGIGSLASTTASASRRASPLTRRVRVSYTGTMPKKSSNGNGKSSAPGRIAIVSGLRTPFAKQGTAYKRQSALDLAKIVVAELLQRAELDPREVGLCVFGQVVPSLSAPNIAREVVLGTALPKDIEAFSVSRACATSLQSMTSAAEAMLAGQHDVAVTGGADSASDVPIAVSKRLAQALLSASKARSLAQKLSAFSSLSPRDLLPVPPALTEPTTGLTMGESAEKMAKEAGITREDQDALAHRSHVRAAEAWAKGIYAEEVMHVVPGPAYDTPIGEDNLVRKDSTLDAYARL